MAVPKKTTGLNLNSCVRADTLIKDKAPDTLPPLNYSPTVYRLKSQNLEHYDISRSLPLFLVLIRFFQPFSILNRFSRLKEAKREK